MTIMEQTNPFKQKPIKVFILSKHGRINWINAKDELHAVLIVNTLNPEDTFLCTDTNLYIRKTSIDNRNSNDNGKDL